ncbi:exosome component 4 [Anaeromyces robustus]|uniref:Ribosomal RNA-processing protein 41 n=1 Tax=Anaeromyces robustus TaxID=1754192 RepID=A0A1Y1XPU1_9FUNG|nr:exosome component 4 [Anaeromyces robustus]|eukprot:ORX87763.1 exosome component 4 [Anaeromyces robustus]
MSSGLDLLSPEGLRIDGRRANELRRVNCKTGILVQADGSAYIEQGNTKCIATVYGPREPSHKNLQYHDRASINVEYSIATFSTSERKQRSKMDRRFIEIANIVKQTFETAVITSLYPRSQIDIYLQILQIDGGALHTSINAATLALIDAGIPMKEYVCACSAGCVEDTPILDLNYFEENNFTPTLTVAVMPNSGKISTLVSESRLHLDKFEPVFNLAVSGCKQLHSVFDDVIRKSTTELANRVMEKQKE